jgi:hypothetical protein
MRGIILVGLAALGLAGCNTSTTAITAAICTDATTLQGSSLQLNKNATLALNGILTTCASTAGGTSFSNATLALAIIQDAILLQGSGLLSDVHITAEAPKNREMLQRMKLKWESMPELKPYL